MVSTNAVTMIHDAQVHISQASYSPAFRAWYHLVQPILGRRNRAILTASEFSRGAIAEVGLAPLEAMQLGCPALVALCGALPEVCGDSALYVAPDDPMAWVTQILRMATDPTWRAHWAERVPRQRASLGAALLCA